LYLGCPYFKGHLAFHQYGSLNPSTNCSDKIISLPAIPGAIVKLVVEYVYEGSVDIKDDQTIELLKVVHFLMMAELVKYCDILLRNQPTKANAVDCFHLANAYNLNTLRSRSKELVLKHIYDSGILGNLINGFEDFALIKLLFKLQAKTFSEADNAC
jgi:hypothetical protein